MNTKNTKYEKNKKRSPKQNIGFYVSLAICAAAIAGAAWTTYGSILEYTESDASNVQEQSGEASVDKEDGNEENDSSDDEEISRAASEVSSDTQQSSEQSSSAADTDVSDEISALETAADTSTVSPIENGKIQKIFSPDELIESKTTSDWRTHNGIDISAEEGTPVRAMTSGTVISVTNDAMLGNIICINHTGGYTAYYCGLSDTSIVQEGTVVATGDIIGYVASVPCEMLDESHLHFAVTLNDEYIDPSELF